MNIVNETANKVQELEKRLDNYMGSSELKTYQLKKQLAGNVVGETEHFYLVGSYLANATNSGVVLQGVLEFVGPHEGTSVFRVSVRVDGYFIHTEEITLNAGEKKTVNVIRALPVGATQQKFVEVITVLKSGELAFFMGWDFFLWGYGVELISGQYLVKSRLNATKVDDENIAVYLVDDKMGFIYYGKPDYSNFSIASFMPLGDALFLAGAVINKNETDSSGEVITTPILHTFYVDGYNELRCYTGPTLSDVNPNVYIDGVTGLSVTENKDRTAIIVVYSIKKELYYFEVKENQVTESVHLFTFSENIVGLELIKNCLSTQFLVVSLESGKNYLFSSVTEATGGTKESTVSLGLKLSFL